MFSLKSPIDSFIKTVKGVLLQPKEFFASVSWNSVPVADSLVYAFVCSLVPGIISFLIPSITVAGMFSGMMGGTNAMATAGGFLPVVLFGPILSIVFLAFGALVVYGVVRYGFKKTAGYPAFLGAMAAAVTTSLLSWIPIVGILVALFGIVLAVIGIRAAGSLTTVQAIVAFVATIIVMMLLSGIFSAALLGPLLLGAMMKP